MRNFFFSLIFIYTEVLNKFFVDTYAFSLGNHFSTRETITFVTHLDDSNPPRWSLRGLVIAGYRLHADEPHEMELRTALWGTIDGILADFICLDSVEILCTAPVNNPIAQDVIEGTVLALMPKVRQKVHVGWWEDVCSGRGGGDEVVSNLKCWKEWAERTGWTD